MTLTASQTQEMRALLRAALAANSPLGANPSDQELLGFVNQLQAESLGAAALTADKQSAITAAARALMSGNYRDPNPADSDIAAFFTQLATDAASASPVTGARYAALRDLLRAALSPNSRTVGNPSIADLWGYFGSFSSGFASPQFFDTGPVGTWQFATAFAGAAPAYYRDSWNKFRIAAATTNPTLTINVTANQTRTATVQIYVNGVFQVEASGAATIGVPLNITQAVTCAAGAIIELRAGILVALNTCTPGAYQAAPAAPAKRLLILGDSVSQGFNANAPEGGCYANRLVDDPPGASWRITDMAYTGSAVANFGNAGWCAQTFGDIAANRADGTAKNVVLVALGVNDFLTSVTAANVQTYMGTLLAGLRLAMPTCGICVVTPLIGGSNDTATNSVPSSLPAYRSGIIAATSGYSDLIVVDGLAIMTNADEADGSTHPNNAGHLKYKNVLKPAILAQWGA